MAHLRDNFTFNHVSNVKNIFLSMFSITIKLCLE